MYKQYHQHYPTYISYGYIDETLYILMKVHNNHFKLWPYSLLHCTKVQEPGPTWFLYSRQTEIIMVGYGSYFMHQE